MLEVSSKKCQTLALAAKRGDREARNALYFLCEPLLKARCTRSRRIAESFANAGGPITGEDVDQQKFILFCEVLERWQPGRELFELYLNRSVGWAARRYVRDALGYRRARRVVRLVTRDERGETWEPESESAARDMRDAEDRADWRDRTEGLDERWKRLIGMKYLEELTTPEIAVIDGHSRRTISRDLRSAVDAVRGQLVEWWEDCG